MTLRMEVNSIQMKLILRFRPRLTDPSYGKGKCTQFNFKS